MMLGHLRTCLCAGVCDIQRDNSPILANEKSGDQPSWRFAFWVTPAPLELGLAAIPTLSVSAFTSDTGLGG